MSRANIGRLTFVETKAGFGRIKNLTERQQRMERFVRDVLSAASEGRGAYKNLDLNVRRRAASILEEFEDDPLSVSGILIGVDYREGIIRVSPWDR